MGASFLWRSTENKQYLDYKSGFSDDIVTAFNAAFGSEPWRIGKKDIDVLRGMNAAGLHVAGVLIEILSKTPEIDVWREW